MVTAMRHDLARRAGGFTLIEMMVVVAILCILAAFAAPGMSRLLATQKIRSASYDLNADLTYARGEAIARGHQVTVKSLSGGTDWVSGWEIWDVTASPNVKLRQQDALAQDIGFTADAQSVTYERTGRATATPATASGTVSFTIAPRDTSAATDSKRYMRLEPSARPTTAVGACS